MVTQRISKISDPPVGRSSLASELSRAGQSSTMNYTSSIPGKYFEPPTPRGLGMSPGLSTILDAEEEEEDEDDPDEIFLVDQSKMDYDTEAGEGEEDMMGEGMPIGLMDETMGALDGPSAGAVMKKRGGHGESLGTVLLRKQAQKVFGQNSTMGVDFRSDPKGKGKEKEKVDADEVTDAIDQLIDELSVVREGGGAHPRLSNDGQESSRFASTSGLERNFEDEPPLKIRPLVAQSTGGSIGRGHVSRLAQGFESKLQAHQNQSVRPPADDMFERRKRDTQQNRGIDLSDYTENYNSSSHRPRPGLTRTLTGTALNAGRTELSNFRRSVSLRQSGMAAAAQTLPRASRVPVNSTSNREEDTDTTGDKRVLASGSKVSSLTLPREFSFATSTKKERVNEAVQPEKKVETKPPGPSFTSSFAPTTSNANRMGSMALRRSTSLNSHRYTFLPPSQLQPVPASSRLRTMPVASGSTNVKRPALPDAWTSSNGPDPRKSTNHDPPAMKRIKENPDFAGTRAEAGVTEVEGGMQGSMNLYGRTAEEVMGKEERMRAFLNGLKDADGSDGQDGRDPDPDHVMEAEKEGGTDEVAEKMRRTSLVGKRKDRDDGGHNGDGNGEGVIQANAHNGRVMLKPRRSSIIASGGGGRVSLKPRRSSVIAPGDGRRMMLKPRRSSAIFDSETRIHSTQMRVTQPLPTRRVVSAPILKQDTGEMRRSAPAASSHVVASQQPGPPVSAKPAAASTAAPVASTSIGPSKSYQRPNVPNPTTSFPQPRPIRLQPNSGPLPIPGASLKVSTNRNRVDAVPFTFRSSVRGDQHRKVLDSKLEFWKEKEREARTFRARDMPVFQSGRGESGVAYEGKGKGKRESAGDENERPAKLGGQVGGRYERSVKRRSNGGPSGSRRLSGLGLNTEKRRRERMVWEEKMREKEKVTILLMEQQKAEEEERERLELQKLRQQLVIRANPLPDYVLEAKRNHKLHIEP